MRKTIIAAIAVAAIGVPALAHVRHMHEAPPPRGPMNIACAIHDGKADTFIDHMHARLEVTAQQEGQWKTFRAGILAAVAPLGDTCGATAVLRGKPLPERLDAMAAHQRLMADVMANVKAAALPMYAALSDGQKAKADHLMSPRHHGPHYPGDGRGPGHAE